MLSSTDAQLKYGAPNTKGTGYLVSFRLPYPMYTTWSPKTLVNTISCHKDIAVSLKAIFNSILIFYGLARIKELGLDQYGGCFEYRPNKNNKNVFSLHSWGLALDLDPNRNLNKETSKTARFAKPEYKPMIDIFYDHGWESLGREKNFDWMHFQPKLVTLSSPTVKKK